MTNATNAERRRWMLLREVGCIACFVDTGIYGTPPDMHHEVKGYRTGHSRTAALCPYHHRGVLESARFNAMIPLMHPDEKWPEAAKRLFGPSLALNPAEFRERYGSDAHLIALCDTEIERLEANTL